MILQELFRLELGWDEPIPEQLAICWSKWISNLTCLSDLKVDRYFSDFEDADQIELHILCDASQDGYGVVAYLRQSVQRDHFHKEIDYLQRNKIIDKNVLTGFKPVVFEGVLRVGGRLDKDYHERVGHVGMFRAWATIRQKFWIVKGAATVRNVLGQCLSSMLCEEGELRKSIQLDELSWTVTNCIVALSFICLLCMCVCLVRNLLLGLVRNLLLGLVVNVRWVRTLWGLCYSKFQTRFTFVSVNFAFCYPTLSLICLSLRLKCFCFKF